MSGRFIVTLSSTLCSQSSIIYTDELIVDALDLETSIPTSKEQNLITSKNEIGRMRHVSFSIHAFPPPAFPRLSAAINPKNIFLLVNRNNRFLLSNMCDRNDCSAGLPDAPREFTIGRANAEKDC
jgi:hypothetical protein